MEEHEKLDPLRGANTPYPLPKFNLWLVLNRLILTFIYPLTPYYDFFDKTLKRGILGLFLAGFFILDSIFFLIIAMNPEKIYLGGTIIAIAIEWVVVHVGLLLLQNMFVFLLFGAFLAISFLIGYLNLLFHLPRYFKYVFRKD